MPISLTLFESGRIAPAIEAVLCPHEYDSRDKWMLAVLAAGGGLTETES